MLAYLRRIFWGMTRTTPLDAIAIGVHDHLKQSTLSYTYLLDWDVIGADIHIKYDGYVVFRLMIRPDGIEFLLSEDHRDFAFIFHNYHDIPKQAHFDYADPNFLERIETLLRRGVT